MTNNRTSIPHIKVIQEDLATIKDDWKKLYTATKSDNPFLSWDWFETWSTKTKNIPEPCILVAREKGKVVGIVPLSLVDRRLSFYRDPMLANYSGFLILPNHNTARIALLKHISQMPKWRTCTLDRIRSISGILDHLDAQFSKENLVWRRDTICLNPRIATIGEFSSYMSRRKKRLRQEIRTSENNLIKVGGWSYREASNSEEAIEIFDALVGFHSSRQSKKIGNSIFEIKKLRNFLRDLINSPIDDFNPHLSAIDSGGRVVSAVLSLRCGKSFYYWIPSFDDTIRSVSLGKLHIKCLVEKCFLDGTDWFDFMGGEESYKFQWADDSYKLFRYRIHRKRMYALFDLLSLRFRRMLKNIKSRSLLLKAIWFWFSKLRR